MDAQSDRVRTPSRRHHRPRSSKLIARNPGHTKVSNETGEVQVTFLRRVHNKTIAIAQHRWGIDLPDHSLVVASITTGDATLTLRHQAETLTTYTYPIPQPVTHPYYPAHPQSIYHHA